ncbi:MAG: hypothetical protein ABH883_07460 [Candidatus Omnitrophota bacterium]
MRISKIIRPLIYLSIIALFLLSVRARQEAISLKRAAEPVSYISEIKKHGRPVTVEIVKGGSFRVTEKLTVTPVTETGFEGYVTRKTADRIKEGSKVNVLDERSVARGKVSSVGRDVDILSGLYRVTVDFEGPVACDNGKLLIEVEISETEDVLAVPNEALEIVRGKFYVWKLDDGKAYMREVELSAREGRSSIIGAGLNNGDMIVVTGQSQLHEGDKVRVIGNSGRGRGE